MNLESASLKIIDDRRRGLSTPEAADLEKRTSGETALSPRSNVFHGRPGV